MKQNYQKTNNYLNEQSTINHNQVPQLTNGLPQAQMTSDQVENVKVAVRLRPFTEKERQKNNRRIVDIEQNTVVLFSPKNKNDVSMKKFTFDHSYWSHDGFKRDPQTGINVLDFRHENHKKYVGQERVFEDLGQFLLANALQGYNSALLAYGQTGSGKSYTVSGYGQNEGILPRFARALFEELDKKLENDAKSLNDNCSSEKLAPLPADKNSSIAISSSTLTEDFNDSNDKPVGRTKKLENRYEVFFSMIEIYNEVVRDLLAKQQGHDLIPNQLQAINRKGLKVREHPKQGFFVENLTTHLCVDKDEIESRIEEGQLNKSIAATSMNETSSRGHTIYEFKIKQYRMVRKEEQSNLVERNSSQETITTSVVQLVDLAGSERMAVHVTGGNQQVAARQVSAIDFGGVSGNNKLKSPALDGNVNGFAQRGDARRGKIPTGSASSSSASAQTSNSSRSKLAPGSVVSMNVNSLQRFKESISINQSLSALGNCIQVMSHNSQLQQQQQQTQTSEQAINLKRLKIPYRDSVLTKLLNRCCLSGNSKVVIIATLSPADSNYDDTLSTLRFADRAKQIKTHAVVNRDLLIEKSNRERALQRENERLKEMVTRQGGGAITKSDDSSQTSNFDDGENVMDNFSGSKRSANKVAKGGRTSNHVDIMATPITSRAATVVRKSNPTTNGRRLTTREEAGPNMAASNPTLDRSISPNAGRGRAKKLSSSPERRLGKRIVKSQSVAQGLNNAAIKGRHFSSNYHEEEEEESNEVVDVDFDDGLMSPDSDDSFAALADEDLSNDEKISIFNKLLSNSTIQRYSKSSNSNGIVKHQQRPKRASRIKADIREVAMLSSSLKKCNPYLSNLNQDEQLTGQISYIIKKGCTIVGRSEDCDIMLHGPELRAHHARLLREGEDEQNYRVYLEPTMAEEEPMAGSGKRKSDGVNLMVNGVPIRKRVQLNHCDRILFGTNLYFVFVDNNSLNSKNNISSAADLDLVTFETARGEVLRKVMSEAENEAVIQEIKEYSHRPGTGKQKQRLAKNTDNSKQTKRASATIEQSVGLDKESKTDESDDNEDLESSLEHGLRDQLMEDTYEYAMPVAEVNAVAKEMGIKVTYGLKILTGEEQLLDLNLRHQNQKQQQQESAGNLGGTMNERDAETNDLRTNFEEVVTRVSKLDSSLDIPPALYIKVHLEESNMDFYWSKEKFQARRYKILELYGPWDVGGKSGLVEYLIDQSKLGSNNYLLDPFVDDPKVTFVLIGNAQITLQPIAHLSDLKQSYDLLNFDDEIIGSINIEAIPCFEKISTNGTFLNNFEEFNEIDLKENLLENPEKLIGKKLIFSIKIISCKNLPPNYINIYCQYSLKPNDSIVRTKWLRSESEEAEEEERVEENLLKFNHVHYICFEQVDRDLLDFLRFGFLTIQVVGQYKCNESNGGIGTMKSPTVISTIINSINKYKFKLEQQQQQTGSASYGSVFNFQNGDKASNNNVTNSNSGASSVVSTSATVNLFYQQNEDEDGSNSMNGLSQENLIDMILTKRKLDRAENQLHYLKRTINIAEHYNKKHIPVKTVKKLLNSYGRELDSGSLEEVAGAVAVKSKSNSKHSVCSIQ